MKIDIDFDLPGGGHVHIERQPMELSKFYALVALAAATMTFIFLLKMAGRW